MDRVETPASSFTKSGRSENKKLAIISELSVTQFTKSNRVFTRTEDQQLGYADQSKSVQDAHNPATSRNHDLEEIE